MAGQSNDTTADGLEFDFSNFSARDFRDLVKAQREADIDAAARIYTQIVVSCPAAWGAPDDTETYLNLSFKTFNRIPVMMTEAIKDDTKK